MGYSKLTTRTQKEKQEPRSFDSSDGEQYSHFSHSKSEPLVGVNKYNSLSYRKTEITDDTEEGSYSRISRWPESHATTDVKISQHTLNSPDKADDPPPFHQSYEEVSPPISSNEIHTPHTQTYEEVADLQSNSHPYDEVAFTTSRVVANSENSIGSSIYEDELPDIQIQETPNTPDTKEQTKESNALKLPPVPPRRGASMTKRSNNPPKPPPIKPKPYVKK